MLSALKNRSKLLKQSYATAAARYAEYGVDTEAATARLASISISLQCWQGDDIKGFENRSSELGGGLAITGNYPELAVQGM